MITKLFQPKTYTTPSGIVVDREQGLLLYVPRKPQPLTLAERLRILHTKGSLTLKSNEHPYYIATQYIDTYPIPRKQFTLIREEHQFIYQRTRTGVELRELNTPDKHPLFKLFR